MQAAAPAGAPHSALAIANAVTGRGLGVQGIVLGLAVAVLLFLVGYPLLWLLLGALGMPQSISLEHLQRAFTRPQNYAALVNTLQLALGTGIMSVFLGVPLAWATARSDMPLRQVVHALVALSYITPPYLTALAYIILLGPEAGQFNRLLRAAFGFESGPINIFSLSGVIFVIGIHVFAFTYFLTYSALKSVDASLEESAQMLGAKRWQTTLRINLPLVAPAITGGALLAAIDSLALFGPQAIIGTPAQIVFLPTRIYATIGSYPPRWGEASALSLVLVGLTVAGLALQRGYLERRSYITVTLAHFHTALFSDQVSVRGIINGFKLATAAAALAVLIGAAVAYLDLRTTVRGRRLLDYLAILPLGLPGTVMAVGILLAFIRLPLPIYGTIWILLIAYVARFTPLATRSANATFRQIDPSLEEAGRVTGASWWHALRRILFPLSRPGLLVAFLLVFIPAFGELSATILLYTGGTETIAIAIYRLNDLGQLEVVSALAVFTIAVVLTLAGLVTWLSGSSLTTAETPPVRG